MALNLQAHGATATLHPDRGGLLTHLALRSPQGDTRELLWLPPDFSLHESGWPGGGAPLMFPFAGRVFHQGNPFQYALDGDVRHMPLHGFAYAMPWQVESTSAHSATLVLTETTSSKLLFPFDFRLVATYTLKAQSLTIQIDVHHHGRNPRPMPVALGLHPYFATRNAATCPQLACHALEEIQVLASGAAGKPSPIDPGRNGRIDQGGIANLILAGHTHPEAKLIFPERAEAVRISWLPAEICRYVVLWSREPEQFFCVEPWMGLPDAVSSGAGVAWIPAGERFGVTMEIALCGA